MGNIWANNTVAELRLAIRMIINVPGTPAQEPRLSTKQPEKKQNINESRGYMQWYPRAAFNKDV